MITSWGSGKVSVLKRGLAPSRTLGFRLFFYLLNKLTYVSHMEKEVRACWSVGGGLMVGYDEVFPCISA